MQHISFDFWGTIGKSNPNYSRERTEFLAKFFDVDTDTAKTTYTAVKSRIERAAEETGNDLGYSINIETLCSSFGNSTTLADRVRLSRDLVALFMKHPPVVDPALVVQLLRAKSMGLTLSIGSNTNMMPGRVIKEAVLNQLPFAFTVFSDEMGVAKPSLYFFRFVEGKARAVNPRVTNPLDIVHIGDNPRCDHTGPITAGMRASLVVNADHTAQVLSSILDTVS